MTFRDIYDEHFRFVWRSLRRLGVDASEVGDAVQDVFLVVHRKLDAFDAQVKITTWLFAICRRVASDRRKRHQLRPLLSLADNELDQADEHADVAGDAERHQALRVLSTILDAMPNDHRTVFVLFELDGLSGSDIAELLEIPLGTVHSRLRLARDVFQRNAARLTARDRFRLASNGETP